MVNILHTTVGRDRLGVIRLRGQVQFKLLKAVLKTARAPALANKSSVRFFALLVLAGSP